MIDVQLVWCHVGDWLLSVRPESMSAAAGVPLVLVWEETLEPLLSFGLSSGPGLCQGHRLQPCQGQLLQSQCLQAVVVLLGALK